MLFSLVYTTFIHENMKNDSDSFLIILHYDEIMNISNI